MVEVRFYMIRIMGNICPFVVSSYDSTNAVGCINNGIKDRKFEGIYSR